MVVEKIIKTLENIPDAEANRPVCSIDGQIYTWKQCREIIKGNPESELSKKIITKIEELIK